ncbi:hypothetical protein CALVIDRAFT_528027 [Calocera viscosa TUFC12733]|uniref:PHD-type domain-containing protein n=1 Tax=Calocera viscosa (strain TUFC12733) TaxID=1330018 RepID=A0A167LDF5_CALVF|nr:hypothetical protein CALVIDRAFT_528027 [Calocera viscosa TUFC12733]
MPPRRSTRRPPPSSGPYPSSIASDDTSPSLAPSLSTSAPPPAPTPASRSKRSSVSISRSPEQELSPLASGGSRTARSRGKKSPSSGKLDDVPEHPLPAEAGQGKDEPPSGTGMQDVKMELEMQDVDVPPAEGDVPELEQDGSGDPDADADADEDADGDEDLGETRCWCGNTDDDAFQIQCEICKMWQHGPCMGFTDQSEVEGENFHHWCEICRPELWSTDIRRLTRSAKHKRAPSSGAALGAHPHPPATSPTLQTHVHAHPQPDSPLLPREPKRRATMNSAAAQLDAAELRIADGQPAAGSVEDEGERRASKKRRRADDADVASASVPTPPPAPAQTSRARPSRAAAPAASTPSKRPRAAHNKAKDPPSPSAGFGFLPGATGTIPDHLAHLSFMFTDPPGSGNASAAGGSPTGSNGTGTGTGNGVVQGLGLSTGRAHGTVPINAFSLPALVQHFPTVVAHASPEAVQTPLAGSGSPGSPSALPPANNSTTGLSSSTTGPSSANPATAPVPAHEIATSLALKCKIKWPSKRITPGEMKKRVGAMLMWGMRVGSELERREERGRELGLWGELGPASPARIAAALEGTNENVLDLAVGQQMPSLLPATPAPPAPPSSSTSTTSADLRLLTSASNLTSAAQAQDLLRQLTQRLVQVNELWNSRQEVPMGGAGEGMALLSVLRTVPNDVHIHILVVSSRYRYISLHHCERTTATSGPTTPS